MHCEAYSGLALQTKLRALRLQVRLRHDASRHALRRTEHGCLAATRTCLFIRYGRISGLQMRCTPATMLACSASATIMRCRVPYAGREQVEGAHVLMRRRRRGRLCRPALRLIGRAAERVPQFARCRWRRL